MAHLKREKDANTEAGEASPSSSPSPGSVGLGADAAEGVAGKNTADKGPPNEPGQGLVESSSSLSCDSDEDDAGADDHSDTEDSIDLALRDLDAAGGGGGGGNGGFNAVPSYVLADDASVCSSVATSPRPPLANKRPQPAAPASAAPGMTTMTEARGMKGVGQQYQQQQVRR